MGLANQQESPDTAYVAAMVQGEGTIVVYFAARRGRGFQVVPRVFIYNSDPAVVEEVLRRLFRLGIGAWCKWYPGRNSTGKPVAHIGISGFKRVKALLAQIGDSLVGEKKIRSDFLRALIAEREAVAPKTPYTNEQLEAIRVMFNHGARKSSETVRRGA